MNEIKKQRILKNLRKAKAEMQKIHTLWNGIFAKQNTQHKKAA
jgi:hypothetical protein